MPYTFITLTNCQYNLRRILTGFWWLFVIVTVTTYCGNLVAFLTFPTIEYPISDLNTLVEKVPLVLASVNVSIIHLFCRERTRRSPGASLVDLSLKTTLRMRRTRNSG